MRKNSRIIRSFIAALVVMMLLMMSACSKTADTEQPQSEAQKSRDQSGRLRYRCVQDPDRSRYRYSAGKRTSRQSGDIEYIKEDLGGETGDEYADPYGQGRIVIKQ